MTVSTQVIAIGDALGIVIPDEMLAQLKLSVGDTLHLVERSGDLLLTPDEHVASTIEAANRVTSRYPDTLKRLAE